jgi:hypothetical protein
VVVVVTVVRGVAMSIVDVIDVVAVRDGDVSTTFTVCVVVSFVGIVLGGLALVPVTLVVPVHVSVVDIVDVVAVRDRHVSASLTVGMGVRFVWRVCRCHVSAPFVG